MKENFETSLINTSNETDFSSFCKVKNYEKKKVVKMISFVAENEREKYPQSTPSVPPENAICRVSTCSLSGPKSGETDKVISDADYIENKLEDKLDENCTVLEKDRMKIDMKSDILGRIVSHNVNDPILLVSMQSHLVHNFCSHQKPTTEKLDEIRNIKVTNSLRLSPICQNLGPYNFGLEDRKEKSDIKGEIVANPIGECNIFEQSANGLKQVIDSQNTGLECTFLTDFDQKLPSQNLGAIPKSNAPVKKLKKIRRKCENGPKERGTEASSIEKYLINSNYIPSTNVAGPCPTLENTPKLDLIIAKKDAEIEKSIREMSPLNLFLIKI